MARSRTTLAQRKKWADANHDYVLMLKRNRYARLRQWMRDQKRARGCAVCGATENLEWDHIIPRYITGERCMSESFTTWASAQRALDNPNIQVLCRYHHEKKTNKEFPSRRPR